MGVLCGPISFARYKAGRMLRSSIKMLCCVFLVVLVVLGFTASLIEWKSGPLSIIALNKAVNNGGDLAKTLMDKNKESQHGQEGVKMIIEGDGKVPRNSDSRNLEKKNNGIIEKYVRLSDESRPINKERGSVKESPLQITIPVVQTNKPRKNIIIIAHGRSGSTITGDIFNQHPSVFYLFEPLQTVDRITGRRNGNLKEIEADLLTNMLRCRFSDDVALDMQDYYNKYPNSSKAVGSLVISQCPYQRHHLKWDPKLCAPLKGKQLEDLCNRHYTLTVLKILISRISDKSIGNIMEACVPGDIECKFIFLVRDPRAIIASSRAVTFFRSGKQNEGLRKYSNESCQRTIDNVLFVGGLSPVEQSRIMITRYEDFAINPLGVLENLYRFASLKSTESLKDWLFKRTRPKGQISCKNVFGFCTIDNANEAVNRWRVKVSLSDIMIMEEHCLNAIKLLGYKPLEWSKELLLNTSIPLYRETFIAKEWFSHH